MLRDKVLRVKPNSSDILGKRVREIVDRCLEVDVDVNSEAYKR